VGRKDICELCFLKEAGSGEKNKYEPIETGGNLKPKAGGKGKWGSAVLAGRKVRHLLLERKAGSKPN
jgi:hypothetical protein